MYVGLAAYGTHVKGKPADFKRQNIKSSDSHDFKEESLVSSS